MECPEYCRPIPSTLTAFLQKAQGQLHERSGILRRIMFLKTMIKLNLLFLVFKTLQKEVLPCSLTQITYEPSSGSVHCFWSALRNASFLLTWRSPLPCPWLPHTSSLQPHPSRPTHFRKSSSWISSSLATPHFTPKQTSKDCIQLPNRIGNTSQREPHLLIPLISMICHIAELKK